MSARWCCGNGQKQHIPPVNATPLALPLQRPLYPSLTATIERWRGNYKWCEHRAFGFPKRKVQNYYGTVVTPPAGVFCKARPREPPVSIPARSVRTISDIKNIFSCLMKSMFLLFLYVLLRILGYHLHTFLLLPVDRFIFKICIEVMRLCTNFELWG